MSGLMTVLVSTSIVIGVLFYAIMGVIIVRDMSNLVRGDRCQEG